MTTQPNRRDVTAKDVRAWALRSGVTVADRGRIRPELWQQFIDAHQGGGRA